MRSKKGQLAIITAAVILMMVLSFLKLEGEVIDKPQEIGERQSTLLHSYDELEKAHEYARLSLRYTLLYGVQNLTEARILKREENIRTLGPIYLDTSFEEYQNLHSEELKAYLNKNPSTTMKDLEAQFYLTQNALLQIQADLPVWKEELANGIYWCPPTDDNNPYAFKQVSNNVLSLYLDNYSIPQGSSLLPKEDLQINFNRSTTCNGVLCYPSTEVEFGVDSIKIKWSGQVNIRSEEYRFTAKKNIKLSEEITCNDIANSGLLPLPPLSWPET